MSATQSDSMVTENISEGARLTLLLLLEQSVDTLKLNTPGGLRQFSGCGESERERVMFELRKAFNERPKPQCTADRPSEWWRSIVQLVRQATNRNRDFGNEKPMLGQELLSVLPKYFQDAISNQQQKSKESGVSTSFLLKQGLNAPLNSDSGEHLWKIVLLANLQETKDWIASIAKAASDDYFASTLLADSLEWLDSRNLDDGHEVLSALRVVGSIAGFEKLSQVVAALPDGAGPKRDEVTTLSTALEHSLLFSLGSVVYNDELWGVSQ